MKRRNFIRGIAAVVAAPSLPVEEKGRLTAIQLDKVYKRLVAEGAKAPVENCTQTLTYVLYHPRVLDRLTPEGGGIKQHLELGAEDITEELRGYFRKALEKKT